MNFEFKNNQAGNIEKREALFSGEIKENPEKGKILVVAGYHFEEKNWGEAIQKSLKENIKDNGKHLIFLSIKNKEVAGGIISPESEREIDEFVKENGGWNKFEAIIDIHDQHEDDNKQQDLVKLWLGDDRDNKKNNLFQKELSNFPRGGQSDFVIENKYHPRVNKDNWQEDKDLKQTLNGAGINSYGLSNSKIPVLGFDASISKMEIKNYLKTGKIDSDNLNKAVNSHLKTITRFSNLILDSDFDK